MMEPAFIVQRSTQYTAEKFIVYGSNYDTKKDDTLRLGALQFSVYSIVENKGNIGPSGVTHQMSLVLQDYTGQTINIDRDACLYHV
jgi:hypothetical protein